MTLKCLTPLSLIHGALGALVMALWLFCTCKGQAAPIGTGVVVGAVELDAVIVIGANVHADVDADVDVDSSVDVHGHGNVDAHAYEDVDVDAD